MSSLELIVVDTPVGLVRAVWHARGLKVLAFETEWPRRLESLQRRYPGAAPPRGDDLAEVGEAIVAWFDGDRSRLEALPVDPDGTEFQLAVWEQVQAIPAGRTRTYGDIAHAIGKPDASRAVGAANGANPVALRIPCHRVVGAKGELTGYAGGLARKDKLLALEARQGSLF